MHQVSVEDEEYERLERESARTGRSIGELVRSAINKEYGNTHRERLLQAVRESAGSAEPEDFDGLSGEEYVEKIRRGWSERAERLGWRTSRCFRI
jgi:hypothetical protein